jgi:hypothetical protein
MAEVRRLRRSLEATLRALRATGRLEPCDQLLVGLARTAADRADSLAEPDRRQYLKVLNQIELRLRMLGGPVDDAFAELLAQAAGPATASQADL